MALRHFVQTATFFGEPLTSTLIFCTFALKRRRVRRCEWEMVFPNPGVFPQMSQTEAITPHRVPQRHPPERPGTVGGAAAERESGVFGLRSSTLKR